MAKFEKDLVPLLGSAGLYADYAHFRNAHREKLEASEAFTRWHEYLLDLAERDGRQVRREAADSMQAWEKWYNHYVQPLRAQMWLAWEAWHDLPALYQQVKRQLPLHALQPPSPLETEDRPVPLCVADGVPEEAAPLPTVPCGTEPPPPPGTTWTLLPAAMTGMQGLASAASSISNQGPSWNPGGQR